MREFNIETIADVQSFFEYLNNELNLSFHPDDDFEGYVSRSGERFFDDFWAAYYNSTMESCFNVCEREGIDIYELGYIILN